MLSLYAKRPEKSNDFFQTLSRSRLPKAIELATRNSALARRHMPPMLLTGSSPVCRFAGKPGSRQAIARQVRRAGLQNCEGRGFSFGRPGAWHRAWRGPGATHAASAGATHAGPAQADRHDACPARREAQPTCRAGTACGVTGGAVLGRQHGACQRWRAAGMALAGFSRSQGP